MKEFNNSLQTEKFKVTAKFIEFDERPHFGKIHTKN